MKKEWFFPSSRNSLPQRLRAVRFKFAWGEQAFSRIDLMMVLSAVFLLLAVALPVLANKARSQQVTCFNNLRQIGRAFHLWGNDHEDMFPPYVRVAEGGLQGQATTAWFVFGVLSNELGTAKILACPSDDKRPAEDFSLDPNQGLFHANFRNSAVSYFIAHPWWREPRNVLCGDRNLAFDVLTSSCSVFRTVSGILPFSANTRASWTNSIHFNAGHFLFVDGQVSLVDNFAIRAVLKETEDDNGIIHFLTP